MWTMSLNFSFTSGYNPPRFLIDAAQEALTKVDCNQYSPTRVTASPTRPTQLQLTRRAGPATTEEGFGGYIFPPVWEGN